MASKSAALFVDGRYTLQAPGQVDTSVFDILEIPKNTPEDWIKKHLNKGGTLGYDPKLHSIKAIERLQRAADKAGVRLAAQNENLVDTIWADRPAAPCAAVSLHPLEYSGALAAKKNSINSKTYAKI